jgi:hypothetical protein
MQRIEQTDFSYTDEEGRHGGLPLQTFSISSVGALPCGCPLDSISIALFHLEIEALVSKRNDPYILKLTVNIRSIGKLERENQSKCSKS